jgi:hypothetical protein
MTFQHQAGTLFLTLKHPDDIRSPRFHLFDDYIKTHPFEKLGKEKSYLPLTASSPLPPHTRDSDEILSEPDEFLSLNLF